MRRHPDARLHAASPTPIVRMRSTGRLYEALPISRGTLWACSINLDGPIAWPVLHREVEPVNEAARNLLAPTGASSRE